MIVRIVDFFGRRLVGAVVVLLVITALAFVIFHFLPSDVSLASCGKPCTAARRAEVRHFLGYDQALYTQFWHFIEGIFTGRSYGSGGSRVDCSAPCFGYSFRLGETVTSAIGQRIGISVSIALGGMVVWLLIGVSIGVVAALKRGTRLDRSLLAATVFGVSAPTYLIGLLGIYLLGFKANVLPVGSYVSLSDSPLQWAWHLVLPWLTIAFTQAAIYARFTRSQLLETMGDDYVRTARAKGLRERRVVVRHGLRNALLPVVTLLGVDVGGLLGGTVITERLFSMPGVGALLVDSTSLLDLPVVLGIALYAAIAVIVANLVVDLVYSTLDARIAERA